MEINVTIGPKIGEYYGHRDFLFDFLSNPLRAIHIEQLASV